MIVLINMKATRSNFFDLTLWYEGKTFFNTIIEWRIWTTTLFLKEIINSEMMQVRNWSFCFVESL